MEWVGGDVQQGEVGVGQQGGRQARQAGAVQVELLQHGQMAQPSTRLLVSLDTITLIFQII